MIKLLLDLLNFLMEYAPLLISTAGFVLLFLWLSKSIKRHASIYYIIFAIPFVLTVIDFVCSLVGIQSNLFGLPVIGQILRENMHIAGFGYPLLIIIMFVGALNPKNPNVKKMLNIRSELSIISGFPVLSHSLVRVVYNLPASLTYYTDPAEYMQKNDWITNHFANGLTVFGYVFIGILLLVLFLPLWISSFKSVRKRMGSKKWKKLQRWSYVFYALLFLHSIFLNIGWLLNPMPHHGGAEPIKGIIAIVSVVLIFGTYLVLRLRKAKLDKLRKTT